MGDRSLKISATLPSPLDGFQKYAADVRRFPLLSHDEEVSLARELIQNQSKKAAHRLITSHLRLVIVVASKYKGYGLPVVDLVAEGNIGLIQAVKRFDPERGFRLATYAIWWIRAAIQEYILRSWSLVKIGTTAAQKKLFFGLNKAKKHIDALDRLELRPEDVKLIADKMSVPDHEVIEMNRRMGGGDMSLNTPMIAYDNETSSDWQDNLVDEGDNQEVILSEKQEEDYRMYLLQTAMQKMTPREQDIIVSRKMTEPPVILEELSEKYAISRERVRQIETRAYEKLKENVQKLISYDKPKLVEG